MKQIIPFHKEILFKTMIGEITSIALDHTLKFTSPDIIEGEFIVSGSYKMTEASQIEEPFNYPITVDVAIDDKYDTKDATISIDDFYYEIINDEILKVNIDLLIDGLEEHQVILAEKVELNQEDTPVRLETQEEEIDILEDIDPRGKEDRSVLDDLPFQDESQDLFKQTNEEVIQAEIVPQEEITLPIANENIEEAIPKAMENPSHEIIQENVVPMEMPKEKVIKVKEKQEESSISSIFEALNDDLETFSTYSVYIVRENDTIESILDHYQTTREDLAQYNNLDEVKIGTKLVIPTINAHESV